jgi:hypothetical protein
LEVESSAGKFDIDRLSVLATIAQQATVLSDTIKSQLISVKAFLERNGIDTGYFDLGNQAATSQASSTSATSLGCSASPT